MERASLVGPETREHGSATSWRGKRTDSAQQPPLAKNPQGGAAFSAGTNEAVSNVVESGLIVTVVPAVPPLLYVPVEEPDPSVATLSPSASSAATPTPATIGLMFLYISTSEKYPSRLVSNDNCCLFTRGLPPSPTHRDRPMTAGLWTAKF
jgi:hypothetical protein